MVPPAENSSETNRLLGLCKEGDAASLGVLLARHENRLRRLIAFRFDPRLQSRIDPSDVIQEAHLAVSRSLGGYLKESRMSLHQWLRGIVSHKLLELHRFHLGTPSRDLRREVSFLHASVPDAMYNTTPSETAMWAEDKVRMQAAINRLNPRDREILALRHFQLLTNAEAAGVLGITVAAAGKRYLRALELLRGVLEAGL